MAHIEKSSFCDRDCRAEHIVLTRQVKPVVRGMPPYVRRPLIEAALEHVIGHIDQSYVVLVGPRGAGKTRVVEAAVANKTGVLGCGLSTRKVATSRFAIWWLRRST